MSETYLYLNSKDAVNSNSSTGDYSWNLNWTGNSIANYKLYIDEVAIPNCEYAVNSHYNTIVFNEGAGDITATLTQQNYTGTQLATELKTQLDSAGGDTYTVVYDTQTFKLTITSTGTFQITAGTAFHVCGFRVMSSLAASYVSEDIVRLDGTSYIDFITSIGKSSFSTSNKTNTFYRIPIQSEIGSMVYYHQMNESGIKIQDNQLNSFNIRLFDDRENTYNLPRNCQVSLTIRLKPL